MLPSAQTPIRKLLILKFVMHANSAVVQNICTKVCTVWFWFPKVFASIKEVGE